MRLLPVALLLAACHLFDGEPAPQRYEVVRGDTLGEIATAHDVTVDELRAWNDLQGDLIEVGQVLLIHSGAVPKAPAATAQAKRRGAKPTPAPAEGGYATLVLPAERACLSGPQASDLTVDEGFTSSQGLSYDQVAAAMRLFVPETLRCIPEGTEPAGTLRTHLVVACTGRVATVEVTDDGGLPDDVVSCVRDTLRYAAFPAHDFPDGFPFDYPLTFSF